MKHYILCGTEAVRALEQEDYSEVSKLIMNYSADVYSIESLDELDELLEQLRGWNEFKRIDEFEYKLLNL